MLAASFGGFDDMKPKVIRVDFAELPIGRKARMKALRENGQCRIYAIFMEVILIAYRLFPTICHLAYPYIEIHAYIHGYPPFYTA